MGVSGGLAGVDAALCRHFGQQPQRASISFVGVAPIEVLRFEPIPGERAYLTLGMSRQPMSDPANSVLDETGPRAELMLHIRDAIDEHADVWRQFAVLAAAPVVEGVVYAAGVTVDLGRALVAASRCTGGVVVASALTAITTRAGEVSVLQVLPATPSELAWARVRGSNELLARWAEREVDLLDLTRPQVDLS